VAPLPTPESALEAIAWFKLAYRLIRRSAPQLNAITRSSRSGAQYGALTGLYPHFVQVEVRIDFKECQHTVPSLCGQTNARRCHDHVPWLQRAANSHWR